MLKTKKSTKILAINPANRYLSVAVFENQDLVYWAIKTIKNLDKTKFLKKAREIIADLIYTYHPDLVAQEKIYYVQCKKSEKLNKLTQQIKTIVKKMQIDYSEYTPTFVRQQICQEKKSTKTKTFKILADRYPELVVKMDIEKLGRDKYRDQLFDAVALGYFCWMKTNNQSL